LRYSVPLVPHLGASQVAALSDRLVLNHLVSTAASGLYSVGALFAGAISVIADGINRAYVPAAMAGLQSGDQDSLRRMRDLGVSLVTLLSLAAAALSLFAREILGVMTGSAFGDSHLVVPLIAFGFAFSGAYYLFVNILFFDVTLTRLVSLITVGAALLGVVLSYALVSAFGIVGASAAVFLTQAAMAALAAALGARHERVDWDYRRTFMVPIMCLVAVLAGIEAQPAMPVLALLVKSSVWLALAAAVLLGLRGDPAQLVPGWFALVASRARQAASRNRS
jgi:O-antigen/teichoic acid export membrane protein